MDKVSRKVAELKRSSKAREVAAKELSLSSEFGELIHGLASENHPDWHKNKLLLQKELNDIYNSMAVCELSNH